MSIKTTYVYRIEMGVFPDVKELAFCYARNGDCALANIKKLYKDSGYNMFATRKIGEADYKKHSEPFELLSEDEEKYIRRIRSTIGERYSERKDRAPENLKQKANTAMPTEIFNPLLSSEALTKFLER